MAEVPSVTAVSHGSAPPLVQRCQGCGKAAIKGLPAKAAASPAGAACAGFGRRLTEPARPRGGLLGSAERAGEDDR